MSTSNTPNDELNDPAQSPQTHSVDATGDIGTAVASKKPLNYIKWLVFGVVAALLVGAGSWFIVANANKRDVPDLVGMDYSAADALLKGAGPQLSASPAALVEKVPGEFIEIVAQDPKPGSRIHFDDYIEVSVEPVEVTVPDIVGQTLAQSENDLASAGLVVERLNSIPEGLDDQAKDAVSMWKVTQQSVDGGLRVEAGTGITLSLDIPEVTVPELKAEGGAVSTLDSAQSAFETGAIGELSRELLVPVFKGKGYAPLSMSPAVGDKVPAFTEVTVTLGIPMPDIVGEKISATEAVAKLESMGFSNVTRAHEDNTLVVSQGVAAGVIIAADAEIKLENKPKGYKYRVTGNGSVADITWSQPGSFNIQQANGTSLPWEQVFDPAMSGTGMLSAFMSDGGTEITCQVIKDGVVIKENTSTGPYAMVSCD